MGLPEQSYAASSDEPGSEGGGAAPIKEQPLTWILLASKFGVSVQTMKVWRQKEGAPVTTDFHLWEAFVKKHELGMKGVGAGSLRDEKLKWEIEVLKAKTAREKRLVIARDEVNRLLLHVATEGRTVLYNLMESELPPKLDGMGAAQMRPILREAADSIADRMAGLIKRFQEE